MFEIIYFRNWERTKLYVFLLFVCLMVGFLEAFKHQLAWRILDFQQIFTLNLVVFGIFLSLIVISRAYLGEQRALIITEEGITLFLNSEEIYIEWEDVERAWGQIGSSGPLILLKLKERAGLIGQLNRRNRKLESFQFWRYGSSFVINTKHCKISGKALEALIYPRIQSLEDATEKPDKNWWLN